MATTALHLVITVIGRRPHFPFEEPWTGVGTSMSEMVVIRLPISCVSFFQWQMGRRYRCFNCSSVLFCAALSAAVPDLTPPFCLCVSLHVLSWQKSRSTWLCVVVSHREPHTCMCEKRWTHVGCTDYSAVKVHAGNNVTAS